MTSKSRVVSFAFLVLFLTAVAAAAEPPRWTLRLRGLSSNYDHQFVTSYLATTYFNVDNGSGFEVAAEFRPRQHVGWEISAGRLNFDGRLRTTQLRPISFNPLVLQEETVFTSQGDFGIEPVSLSLLIHPLRGGHFDFYLGPQVAWVRFNVDVEGAQPRDSEPGYGAKLGGEYVFGESPWSVGLEYRHLELLHETLDRDLYGNIGLDIGSLMVGYRFGS